MNNSSVSFKALLLATFTAAFNELAMKTGILLLTASRTQNALYASALFLALAVFPVLPSILLSPFTGLLADKIGKPFLLKITKVIEFILVLAGAYFFSRDQLGGCLVVALLLGVTTSFFTPLKYALIPEIVDVQALSMANGRIVSAKYAAYVAGLAALGSAALRGYDVPVLLASLTSAAGAVGCAAAFLIFSDVRNPSEQCCSWQRVAESWREVRGNRELFLAMLAFAFFLAIGAIFQLITTIYLPSTSGLSQIQTTLLLCALCAGIASGALFAGRVSLGKVEIGLVPIGALGVALFLLFSAFAFHTYIALWVLYFFSGVCGGAAVIPLNSLYQMKSPPAQRGAFLGISHAFSQIIVLAVSLLVLAAHALSSPDPRVLFILSSAATVVVSVIALKNTPVALVRCVNWIFSSTVYRLNVTGAENVPSEGGALLICNHISYLDPLLVSASLQRSVRFLISRRLFSVPVLRQVLLMIRAIPISQKDKPKELVASLQAAREALQKGYVVCVFAEGEPSRVRHMLRFSRGLEHILRGLDHIPIIPAYLDQTWGSLFDRREGKYTFKVPREIPYPASVTFGPALPASSTVFEVRQTISELGTTAFARQKRESRFLQLAFLKEAKSHPFRATLFESSGKKVRNIRALTGAYLLGQALGPRFNATEKNIGIWLPPCIGAALANLAMLMDGKIPVNLNYTASKEALDHSLVQGRIRTIITSRQVAAKLPPPRNAQHIFLEDILESIDGKQRIRALLRMVLTPRWILQKKFIAPDASHDDMATIVFSSGSTGIPKGVMLSHGNISSNVESMYNALDFTRKDMLVGVLPFFHSFGLTTCLWLPLIAGVKVVYHFTPLDAEVIGDMVAREKATVLLGTPTFLLTYIRRIQREKFKSLRWVIVGAEKLRTNIAAAFTDAFGIIPFEGYGCTELSPVAMINVPDLREMGREQVGNKPGTVGHPIPGVAVKVVDVETRKPVSLGETGVLLVKGPNVMKGYLNEPAKTAEVIWDGWYVTGDLATLDADGFVTIRDRISRFSKIAGEMVPHQGLEDAIQRVLGELDPVCAVAGVADEKRGERLLVFYTRDLDVRDLIRKLTEMGLPNLWLPRAEDFHRIEALPVLGSGKLDLQGLKVLAAEICTRL